MSSIIRSYPSPISDDFRGSPSHHLIQLTDVPGKSALCTPLFNVPSSADFATRMAKILARKMRRPVYVGCSVETSGLTGEEEMELFKRTIEVIMQQFRTSREKVEEQKAQE